MRSPTAPSSGRRWAEMILTYDDPTNDLCTTDPLVRSLSPGTRTPCQPSVFNVYHPSFLQVEWSGLWATPARWNNLAPGRDPTKFINWNSGFPQGVLVGRRRRHVLCCRHYLNQMSPAELQEVSFFDRTTLQRVRIPVQTIVWNAHHDTSILRLASPAPETIESYPVCDMRACAPGRKVWLRTCQGQGIPMALKAIGLDNRSAVSFAVQDLPDSMNRIVLSHAGDSGTPVLTVLRNGRTAYCGMLWGPGCVSFGLPDRLHSGHDPNDWSRTSPHAAGWPRLASVLAEIEDELEIVYPDFDPSDVNCDGIIDQADLSAMLSAWGPNSMLDSDGDGLVGQSEVARLLGSWNRRIDPI